MKYKTWYHWCVFGVEVALVFTLLVNIVRASWNVNMIMRIIQIEKCAQPELTESQICRSVEDRERNRSEDYVGQ